MSTERLKQYIQKASFASASDKFSTLECVTELEQQLALKDAALGVAMDGLQKLSFLGNGDRLGNSVGNDLAITTLIGIDKELNK